VTAEVRAAATAALAALKGGGRLQDRVAVVARELGVTERTVWRWLGAAGQQGGSGGRSRFDVTREDIAELTYRHGNVAAVYRARGGEPSVWTLRRAFARSLTPGRRAGVEDLEGASTPRGRPRRAATATLAGRGESVLSDLSSAVAIDRLRSSGLTRRECQVALALVAGLTPQQSAAHLGIGVTTFHKHRERVYTKLGVHTRVVACVAILRLVDS
jgi:DNA-binding CsgD family transcriptional regulator